MNATMIQFFHWYTPGNSFLWDHAAEQASYLAGLGITAAWLPPACKAAGGGYSTGYDVYDLFDLGEFDQKGSIPTRYGNRDQLLNACKVLQKNGVGVIVDVVLNHRGGGDELESFHVVKVDQNDRTNTVSEPYEISSYTKFTFPGRGNKYSAFKWNFTCFTGVDYAEGEEGNGIYRIITDHGHDWDKVIDDEVGNYDFLMLCDVETRNEHVCGELNYWGKWFHEQVGFTRLGDGEHPGCAVVMGNRDAATKRMEMGRSYAGKTFRDALGHLTGEVVIGKDGWGEFPCPAGGVSVWIGG